MKNTVIFDLDGLLIDSEIISFQMYRDLTEKYGRSISLEDYIHGYSGKTGVANMERLIEEYSLPVSLEEGLEFVSVRGKEYQKEGVPLKEGARELLAYLREKGYKILLASSSTEKRAADILTQNGILDFFDDMVFGVNVRRGKPYPDIFIKAREQAGEPAQNCLVLEDSEAGIQAAHSAGIDVICIPDMQAPGKEFCEMAAALLTSLSDVVGWLETHNRSAGVTEPGPV